MDNLSEGQSGLTQGKSFFFFFVFLGPHPWLMDDPRLGVKSELQRVQPTLQLIVTQGP